MSLSEEEIRLIEKFGFRIDGEKALHRKMGIERDLSTFYGFTSLSELEQFIKQVLRDT
ncbi:hypothetical protein [Ammoniphilus sp. YIM 78166]|uniref:hypothetical protein n=1 Tax=Ammoniphilus sp. YIM 78166 TaxID=1644106 RepID=UPI001430DBF9|nr:hypothetical protein [Ammoniphilus sp. YIM 78166]